MTAHTSVHDEHVRRTDQLFQLDWSSFWLLGAILAGMLALVGFVFFAFFGDL